MTAFDKVALSMFLLALFCEWAIRDRKDVDEARNKIIAVVGGIIAVVGGLAVLTLVARLPWIIF